MPFSTAHILTVFTGTMPGGELWNVGLRTAGATPTLVDLEQYVIDADSLFAAHIMAANAGIKEFNSPHVTYTGATSYAVPVSGPATLVATAQQATPPTGSAAAQTAPNQIAIVASLRSDRAGRSNRGRIYLPCDAPLMEADDGRAAAGMTAQVSQGVAALISGMNAIGINSSVPFGPWAIAIESKVSGLAPATVTHVSVGNVLDTQRRRRDKLIEVYDNRAVTPPPGP